MESQPINNSQLAVYLTFTLLSIAISIVVYCIYQHADNIAEDDVRSYTSFYISVCKENKTELFDDSDIDKRANQQRLLY